MYIRAREKALIDKNILSGWKGAGVIPLSPMSVLEKIPLAPPEPITLPRTPSPSRDFDLSLLDSSPPDGTQLRNTNALLLSTLENNEAVPESAVRYAKRMIQAYELTHHELITARNQISAQKQLLEARKKRKKGKRVAIQGKFVFTTEDMLEIVKIAEAETTAKAAKKKASKRSKRSNVSEDEESMEENDSSESELDCIIVASRN